MSDAASSRHGADPLWFMKAWPLVAFVIVQGAWFLWWLASMEATARDLERRTTKIEEVIEALPDMRASVKNIERVVERLDAERFKKGGQ